MQLIDDSGNLFGLVNVVDALVLLLTLAVGVAGVALVTADESGSSTQELATTNATLDLGTQPESVAAAIEAGDTYSPGGDSELTVTDVHVAPQDGDARVYVRVRLRGQGNNGTVAYDGAPPRLGRSLEIQTDSYAVTGEIQSTGGGTELQTQSTPVLLQRNASVETAEAIEVGQIASLAGHEIATIESVTSYRTGKPGQRRLAIGVELATIGEDRARFGDRIVHDGARVPLTTAEHNLTWTVERVGATEPRGEATTREVTLEIERTSPDLAAAIEEGDAERVDGRTVAEITDVERSNATVVVTGDDGTIYLREHPVDQEVTITAELAVRETSDGVLFRGQRIQRGSTVTLDLGDVAVEATVRAL